MRIAQFAQGCIQNISLRRRKKIYKNMIKNHWEKKPRHKQM